MADYVEDGGIYCGSGPPMHVPASGKRLREQWSRGYHAHATKIDVQLAALELAKCAEEDGKSSLAGK